jgi:signal transduction histidine kinase
MHGWCHCYPAKGRVRVLHAVGAARACRMRGRRTAGVFSTMRSLASVLLTVFLGCVLCSPLPAQATVAAPAEPVVSTEKTQVDSGGKKNVLFLNSYHAGYEWSDEVYEAIHSVLDGEEFNLFAEYLDSQRHDGKEYTDSLEKLLRYKYGNSRIDAIIASDHYAVKLALAMRGTFHRGVPLVYLGIDRFIWEHREEYNPIYGLEEEDGGVFGTLDLIFSIHRNVKLIYLVADGDTESTPVMLNYVREVERSGKSGASFKYLVGMSMEEVDSIVKAASPDSVVVWLHFLKDKNGRLMSVTESQKWLARISPVPVYCPYGFQPGSGIMGGHIISGLAQGRRAAEIVLQIFEGRAPPAFYGSKAPLVTKLDYQVMRRFGIGLDDIPADSMVYNKPYSVFQIYRTQILGAMTLIVVLSAMIVYLLLNLARRKQAEEGLVKSQRLLAETEEIGRVGGWEIDLNTMKLRWTPEIYSIHEVDLSFEPTVEKAIQFYVPASRPAIERLVQRAIEQGEPYDVELDIITAKGNLRSVHGIGRADLEHRRVYGFFQDITALKQNEREMGQLRLELTHANRVLILNEISGSIAHEINQPLAAILNNASAVKILLSEAQDKREEIPEIVEDIIKDVNRAADIVRKLRGLVKKGDESFEPLPINSLIHDVLALLNSTLTMNNVTLQLNLKPDLASIKGDRVRLQQVLLNLVMNSLDAMNAMPSRILTVRTEMDAPDIITVSVSDSGPGITEAGRALLFEPFYTTKRNGLGLGLSICQSIIKEHGGLIWGENRRGGGAKFSFSLTTWEDESA